MKHLTRFNEDKSNSRIPKEVVDVIDLFSNYNKAFDMGIFEVFNKIDKLSDDELKELYVSLSTNRRENNSDEENFTLDLIKYFNLV